MLDFPRELDVSAGMVTGMDSLIDSKFFHQLAHLTNLLKSPDLGLQPRYWLGNFTFI